ncbi:hypothetical protein PILCRDRAFT_827888 [Piloderma croceum F 1598]|uniref:Uncharacterized protein n=1 Tax=Piloderma croceum (strain F 1598) TaxID=765440 RepID=A0A0C3BBX3_PILCF|nr:hypothetical protein PILCRDRAFT_827888 [Piloderma croceum F 1598]
MVRSSGGYGASAAGCAVETKLEQDKRAIAEQSLKDVDQKNRSAGILINPSFC